MAVELLTYQWHPHSQPLTHRRRGSEALDDLTSTNPSQGVTHIPITAEQVLQSDGEVRWKWTQSGRKGLDNLSSTGTTEVISPEPKSNSRLTLSYCPEMR